MNRRTDRANPAQDLAASLSHRRELEEQLLRSQRLEALGRLSGEVAHDFNNLLTVILGNAQLVLEGLSPSVQTRAISEIIQAAQRADSLTRQLLRLSRNQPLGEQSLDLNEQIWELKALLQRLLGADIELVTSHQSVGRVRAEPTLIQQVLLNLTVNAREAMPLGGTMTITTDEVDSPDGLGFREARDLAPGGYVTLEVRDTGVGMSPEVADRVFEPFFSTKPRGENTGLGLATVRGAVVRHGGQVAVETSVGRGTTFIIALPRLAAEPEIQQLPR